METRQEIAVQHHVRPLAGCQELGPLAIILNPEVIGKDAALLYGTATEPEAGLR